MQIAPYWWIIELRIGLSTKKPLNSQQIFTLFNDKSMYVYVLYHSMGPLMDSWKKKKNIIFYKLF